MENGKSKKGQRNSNNSDTSNINSVTSTPFSSPVVSPKLSPNELPNELHNDLSNVENKIEKVKISNEVKMNKEETIKKEIKEPSLETLILNLKIISKLKPGYKLSLKEYDNSEEEENKLNVYIDNSYLQYFYRILSDNSRQTTINFLENLDSNISKKIENLLSENNSDMFLNSKENILLNLSHDLNLSLIGLNNLINTYSGDEYTISKIEMIIKNFELKIRKITNILKVD